MDKLILAYIAQRMTDMGYSNYSFEPFIAVLNNNQKEIQIEGTNEYYYLMSKDLATGTEISSDNNYFKAEGFYDSLEFAKTQEFTGQIKMSCTNWNCQQTIVLEFIRVIPQISSDGKEQVYPKSE
jgi:hypothetical protein